MHSVQSAVCHSIQNDAAFRCDAKEIIDNIACPSDGNAFGDKRMRYACRDASQTS